MLHILYDIIILEVSTIFYCGYVAVWQVCNSCDHDVTLTPNPI